MQVINCKSINVLMPQWWGVVHSEYITVYASNSSNWCSLVVGLCTQAEQWKIENLVIHWARAWSRDLGICQFKQYMSSSVMQRSMPWPSLLCSDVLVLKISLGSPSILLYRWTFSRWKVACSGNLTLHWTLDCWQRLKVNKSCPN